MELICHNGIIDPQTRDGSNLHRVSLTRTPVGMKFAYWIDQNSNIFSYNESFENFNNIDMEYTPVFIDVEQEVEKEPVINVTVCRLKNLVEPEKDLAHQVLYVEGNGSEVVMAGEIYYLGEKCPDSMTLENCSPGVHIKNISENSDAFPRFATYVYSMRANLSKASAKKNFYIRGVIQYRNPDSGEIGTKYTGIFEYQPVR